MKKVGRSLILTALLLVLLSISVGDVFPQFSLVDESVLGLSGLLGISYERSQDLFAAFSLVLVGIRYRAAIKKRL
ncbi:MAG: hypothetical protein OK454_04010, partial [Thaumarchaeota archaeon]|jgi:hypothetical protein|nr:hypothetical protein [Nitrososphaerota archaeon]